MRFGLSAKIEEGNNRAASCRKFSDLTRALDRGAKALVLLRGIVAGAFLSTWDWIEESSDTWAPVLTLVSLVYVLVRVLVGVI